MYWFQINVQGSPLISLTLELVERLFIYQKNQAKFSSIINPFGKIATQSHPLKSWTGSEGLSVPFSKNGNCIKAAEPKRYPNLTKLS